MKHGSPETIQKHFDKFKNMQDMSPKDLFDFKMVSSDKWDTTELNKLITNSGYVSLLDSDPNRFKEAIVLNKEILY